MRKPPADLEKHLERYKRELNEAREDLTEALEQQTATSEVLRVISNSPTDVQSVLRAIAESAARLLDVTDAQIMRVEGDALRGVHNIDLASEEPYRAGDPQRCALVDVGG